MSTPTPYDLDIFWLKADRPPGWKDKIRVLVAKALAYREAKGGQEHDEQTRGPRIQHVSEAASVPLSAVGRRTPYRAARESDGLGEAV